jgi:hypothetical protein
MEAHQVIARHEWSASMTARLDHETRTQTLSLTPAEAQFIHRYRALSSTARRALGIVLERLHSSTVRMPDDISPGGLGRSSGGGS